MALGDGNTWDETTPTDATFAIYIDDHIRDVRKGVRSRMAHEHEWPDSQSATGEGGKHKFITFQMRTGAPTLVGTQVGAIYQKTVGTTGDALFFINKATQEINVSDRIYYWVLADALAVVSKAGAQFPLVSDGNIKEVMGILGAAASGGDGVQVDINYNGNSIWTATASQLILTAGTTSGTITAIATAAVTAGGLLTLDIDKIGTASPGSDLTVLVKVG